MLVALRPLGFGQGALSFLPLSNPASISAIIKSMRTYLLRVNLDIKEKNPVNQLRFSLAAADIKLFSKPTNKIVILSHRGRPRGRDQKLSLRPLCLLLEKTTHKKIKFIPDFKFTHIKKEIAAAPGGSIFLLENLRFLAGEEKGDKRLARQLAALGDRYINDDFATSHRHHASLVWLAKFLPSQPGPHLKKEVQTLRQVSEKPAQPFVLILGGAKIKDKIGVIKCLLPKVSWVLLGGGPANTLLKARGEAIGHSLYDPKAIPTIKPLVKNIKIITPFDWQTEQDKILDIGPETAALYQVFISQAATIVWNGPMGYLEKKKFASGTSQIQKAVLANKRAKTIIGGGETVAALPPSIQRRPANNLFISSGGGAMLEFLSGKNLPALEALKLIRR